MRKVILRLWACLLLGLLAGPALAQRLAVGAYHTLSLQPDGSLWAWGNGGSSQLGTGSSFNQATPVQAGTANDWQSVAAGQFNSAAIRADGTLWAWGLNQFGQLGNGTTVTQALPTQVGTATWQSVRIGYGHLVAIRPDGSLWAWGINANGQVGIGTTTNQPVPTPVGAGSTWLSAAAGYYHTVAVRQDGTLWAWGNNNAGQLGTGSAGANQLTPTQVGTATTWKSVVAGYNYTLALRQDGTLWAWGSNNYGQLGTGAGTANQLTPVQVGTASNWASATAGQYHAAALRTDGTLWTWGRNDLGQLGNGTTANQSAPGQIGLGATWLSVTSSPGSGHMGALRTDGSRWTWGQNDMGQLGHGFNLQPQPLQVGPPTTWREVVAGGTCSFGLRADGTLWSWGGNVNGQLGIGFNGDAPSPQQVGTDTNWLRVAAGRAHTLAVRTNGTLWAWGDNQYGEIGSGSAGLSTQPTPLQIGTASTWASVSAGFLHSVAVRTDGTLWAWGGNAQGQLGTGTGPANQATPVQVGTASNWASVSAGAYSTLALRADGTLWAWGSNVYGQLGTGLGTDSQLTPVQVGTASNWASVAGGFFHTVALKKDGTLWTWGYNIYGQLGDGTTTSQPTPVQVGSASTWASVAAGSYHSAAVRTGGSLWAWGLNTSAQLGLGTGPNQLAPTAVGTAASWQQVATGQNHTLALRQDGTLWAWGLNDRGQTGQSSANPVPVNIPYLSTVLATAVPATAAAWTLAPNPAHTYARLLGLPAGPVAGQLFDAQGRLVRTTTSAEVGLAGLAPGLYLLRAQAGGATRTLRLVVE